MVEGDKTCQRSSDGSLTMSPHSDFDNMASTFDHASIQRENVDGATEGNENKVCVSFDEAMMLTGFGKFNVFAVLFVGLILLGMILETLGFSFVIPACQCDLELTLSQKGWLAAIPFIGIIITSHAWGYLADTRGRKKILVFAMGISSFCSILSSFAPDLVTFAALRFITSLFVSAPSSITYTYLGEMSPMLYRDVILTFGNSFIAIGIAVVPLFAWALLPLDFHVYINFLPYIYRPWRLLVALFALPFAICALIFMYFPESPKYLYNKGEHSEALEILKNMYKINLKKPKDNFPVIKFKIDNDSKSELKKRSLLKDIWCQTIPLFKPPYLRYILACCYLQFATFSLVNGFFIWFPDMVNKILNDPGSDIGIPINICGIIENSISSQITQDANDPLTISTCDDSLNTKTFPISILLSCMVAVITIGSACLLKKITKKCILVTLFCISGICTLLMHWTKNNVLTITILAMLQISGTCIGMINAYAIEIFPTDFRAMAVCLTLMTGRIGSTFGTNIIGYLTNTACPVTFILFSFIIFIALILCFTLPDKQKNNISNDVENSAPQTSS